MARNSVRGYGAWQDDFSIRRQFVFRENMKLLFIGEFFNILNHPNFGEPTASLSSALFGQPTTTLATSLQSQFSGFSPLYQIGGTRSVQLPPKAGRNRKRSARQNRAKRPALPVSSAIFSTLPVRSEQGTEIRNRKIHT
ncbi:MAG TPA: hypothetical protein VK724_24130 [Bryobacteraceae bacterium]|nr:hypothetical protein [Bryobacteraceae bacterium]